MTIVASAPGYPDLSKTVVPDAYQSRALIFSPTRIVVLPALKQGCQAAPDLRTEANGSTVTGSVRLRRAAEERPCVS